MIGSISKLRNAYAGRRAVELISVAGAKRTDTLCAFFQRQ
jgi:hypothetical protein